MKPRYSQNIHLDKAKVCSVDKMNRTADGQYLIVPDNPLRQRWVCSECIKKSFSFIVKWNREKGHLGVPQALSSTHG